MEMNWQVIVAVSVVGVAVWHLMRRAFAVLHAPGSHSCGGCSKCPDPDEKQVTLVQSPEFRVQGREPEQRS